MVYVLHFERSPTLLTNSLPPCQPLSLNPQVTFVSPYFTVLNEGDASFKAFTPAAPVALRGRKFIPGSHAATMPEYVHTGPKMKEGVGRGCHCMPSPLSIVSKRHRVQP